MNYQEKYQFCVDSLSKFSNFVEVEDFRKFLLLILNLESGGPEALLQKLGMSSRDKITLPYDPLKKMYFTKIISGLSMTRNQLVIYHKSEKIAATFVNKPDSDLFQQTLSEYELKNLLPAKLVLVTPELVDFTSEILTGDNAIPQSLIGVESLYTDLAELIVTQDLKFIFLLEGDKADVLFAINLNLDMAQDKKTPIQFFDVYVDETQKLRNYTFIRMKNVDIKAGNLEMEFLEEIKGITRSMMFESHFTIIIKIKSMKKP